MDRDQALGRCRGLTWTTEEFPFSPTAHVFKVGGKMFALVNVADTPPTISLKCDPGYAVALREQYAAVRPGYHLNKRHWNTVVLDGSIADDALAEWIRDAYDLALAGLTRAQRAALGKLI